MSNKYHAVRTQASDGEWLDSKRECLRYEELLLLQKGGEIRDLERQPKFAIHAVNVLGVKGRTVAHYLADFRYWDMRHERVVIEDTKSVPTMTPVYKLKKKLVESEYGIEITELI